MFITYNGYMNGKEQQIMVKKMSKVEINHIADSLADEMAKRFYCKMVLLKFLPEINGIEAGKLEALEGSDIHKFLAKLSKAK